MKNLQRIGAVGAFVMAAAYIVGLALAFTVLDTAGLEGPEAVVRFHVDHYAAYYLWITLIYVIAGAALVPLALALHERLVRRAPDTKPLALLGTAFGLIWAVLVLGSGLLHNVGLGETVALYGEDPLQAAFFWHVIETVHVGIGASIEIPGGLWTLLIAVAGLRSGVFPRALNWFALVIGLAGLASVVPAIIDVVVPVYALGQIVWWIVLGVILLRDPLEESSEESPEVGI